MREKESDPVKQSASSSRFPGIIMRMEKTPKAIFALD
jgi:hypothetical protein